MAQHHSMKQIPTSRITALTLGHLSSGESLRVLEEIEKSEGLSAELELNVDLINFFEQQKAEISKLDNIPMIRKNPLFPL